MVAFQNLKRDTGQIAEDGCLPLHTKCFLVKLKTASFRVAQLSEWPRPPRFHRDLPQEVISDRPPQKIEEWQTVRMSNRKIIRVEQATVAGLGVDMPIHRVGNSPPCFKNKGRHPGKVGPDQNPHFEPIDLAPLMLYGKRSPHLYEVSHPVEV